MYCQRLVVVKEFTYLGVKLEVRKNGEDKLEVQKVQSILTFVRTNDKCLMMVPNKNVKY